VIDFAHERGDALEQLGADAHPDFGKALCDSSRQLDEAGAAQFQHVAQAPSLAVAKPSEILERLAQERMRGCEQRLHIASRVADHAGPAQQIQHIDPRPRSDIRRYLLRPPGQRFQERAVHFERSRGRRGTKVQRTVDLATLDRARDGLTKIRFGNPEFFGKPAAEFEKTMVDGLQLPCQQPGGKLPLSSRKTGHATNHRGLRENRP
jgi:hypothetical protein